MAHDAARNDLSENFIGMIVLHNAWGYRIYVPRDQISRQDIMYVLLGLISARAVAWVMTSLVLLPLFLFNLKR